MPCPQESEDSCKCRCRQYKTEEKSGISNQEPAFWFDLGQTFEALIDSEEVNSIITEVAGNYYSCINYQHSTHTITVSLVASAFWS
jgi:hypothetical protein